MNLTSTHLIKKQPKAKRSDLTTTMKQINVVYGAVDADVRNSIRYMAET